MNLLDLMELEEDKIECRHTHEEKTFTVWPGETKERMTWTCLVCKRIRGRC